MTLFFDSANIEHIKEICDFGIISGITTNQKIFLKSGVTDYIGTIKEICDLVNNPVSVELTETDDNFTVLLQEAGRLREIDNHVNIKVPMWGDGKGLFIAKKLIDMKIPVNMTCMMSADQGILACEVGVDYASLFYNRIIDYSGRRPAGQREISLLRDYIDNHGLSTQIIAGSIRTPIDVMECFEAGAHIVTIPYPIMKKLPFHPRTESTIKEFDDAWKEFEDREQSDV